jgi:hypothetical protein
MATKTLLTFEEFERPYTASERPQILTAEDSLTIPSLLPEFAARVADLFEI